MMDGNEELAFDLKRAMEGVGYAFFDDEGEHSKDPTAWGFGDCVVNTMSNGGARGPGCVFKAVSDYIKSAEELKLAVARLMASGAVNGRDFLANEVMEALDASVSIPVEMALELGREGLGWVPVKDGVPSRLRVTEALPACKATADVTVKTLPSGEVRFDLPTTVLPGMMLDLVDKLDGEGLPYSLVAVAARGFERGRLWSLEVDGGASGVTVDLGADGTWKAAGKVSV